MNPGMSRNNERAGRLRLFSLWNEKEGKVFAAKIIAGF
jgi:hypothetical protein